MRTNGIECRFKIRKDLKRLIKFSKPCQERSREIEKTEISNLTHTYVEVMHQAVFETPSIMSVNEQMSILFLILLGETENILSVSTHTCTHTCICMC